MYFAGTVRLLTSNTVNLTDSKIKYFTPSIWRSKIKMIPQFEGVEYLDVIFTGTINTC